MASGQNYFNSVNPNYGANVQKSMDKKENNLQYMKMTKLVSTYNENPSSFSDAEAEQIALIAKTIGLPFAREFKPLKNLMYGAAEGISLGFAPNSWRPTERGEDIYGRSGANKLASGIGMAGGGLAGLGGLQIAGVGATALGSKIVQGAGTAGAAARGAASQYGGAAANAARNAASSARGAASSVVSGVRSGIAGNAPRLSAPGMNVSGPGFTMNPSPAINAFEKAGAGLGSMVQTAVAYGTPASKAAAATARSAYNNSFYYGGQAYGKARSGLSSFMG